MEKILIGTITKPQALKGEFRVKPALFNLKAYKNLKNITIGDKDFAVQKVTLRDAFVIMKVECIDTCELAETLRNKPIYAEMDNAGNSEDSILGFDVILEGNVIGKVADVNNYGATDVLSVVGERNFMVPFIPSLAKVNKESHALTLNKEIFEQVVVYEN
jgi:ribosomal 30S subunit maturation factor RimM